MRLKILFHILLLFTVAAATLFAQATYPLQVGNFWQYEDRWDSTYRFTTRAVAETLMPNGQRYTMLVSDHELDTLFFRQESSRVYSFSRQLHVDELWYDFYKTTFDTVAVHYPPFDTSYITVVYDRVVTFFGAPRHQWGFWEGWKNSSLYALREVTDAIGMTFYQYEPGAFSYDLKGAIINGVKYGRITDVMETGDGHPVAFTLDQNYPNPFNPVTTIRFSLTRSDRVTLDVLDVLGTRITTLIDSHLLGVGEHTAIFNATNLSSGVYYYRLQSSHGNFLVQKMMVIR